MRGRASHLLSAGEAGRTPSDARTGGSERGYDGAEVSRAVVASLFGLDSDCEVDAFAASFFPSAFLFGQYLYQVSWESSDGLGFHPCAVDKAWRWLVYVQMRDDLRMKHVEFKPAVLPRSLHGHPMKTVYEECISR